MTIRFICLIILLPYFSKGQAKINEAFFWFDNDFSKVTKMAITPDKSITLDSSLDVSSLAKGLHTISVRIKQTDGKYSSVVTKFFFKGDSTSKRKINSIVAYRYWFDSSASFTTVNVPFLSSSLSLIDSINTSALTNGKHVIFMQLQDGKGIWSAPIQSEFTYCSKSSPIADFKYVLSGFNVSFINLSKNFDSSVWSFDDGTKSGISHPFHRFDTTGVYKVCNVAYNNCIGATDTFCQLIEVFRGIKKIDGNRGSNAGIVGVDITGAGFVEGSSAFLMKSGQGNIEGDSIFIMSSTSIQTNFDLRGKSLGNWDVVVKYPNGDTSVLKSAFTIEPSNPNLLIKIVGEDVLRIGFKQIFKVLCINRGNEDAIVVPIFIKGLPERTKISIKNQMYRIDSMEQFRHLSAALDTLNYTLVDSSSNTNYRIVFVPRIKAKSQYELDLVFELPNDAKLNSFPEISAEIGYPLFSSEKALYKTTSDADWSKCASTVITTALQKGLEVLVGKNDILNCANGVKNVATKIYQIYSDRKDGRDVLDFVGLAFAGSDAAISCLKLGGTIIPIGKGLTIAYRAAGYILEANDIADEVYKDCKDAIDPIDNAVIQPRIVNSFDPNNKIGPGLSSINHYTKEKVDLNYQINFENDPAANLPAQTIIISDTLNGDYYDWKSFRFSGIIIGDSIHTFDFPKNNFVDEFDFSSTLGVKTRVTGHFDTATGIVNWYFFTIDTNTMQITNSTTAGFLPPNIKSPVGQGKVSFVVNPNSLIKSGDTIFNKAAIVFDKNSSIITNNWQTIFDWVKPESQISALADTSRDTTFTVVMTGSDDLSGVRNYRIFVSINDSLPFVWKQTPSPGSFSFNGQPGKKYSFYSMAKDSAGNVEDFSKIDATTFVSRGDSTTVTGNDFKIYPNPSKDGLFFIQGFGKMKGDISIEIRNVNGQLVLTDKINSLSGVFQKQINLAQHAKGFYSITLRSIEAIQTFKLIKM